MYHAQAPIFLKHRFDDFDAFTSSLPDWQVQFNQLDSGHFVGDIEQIITGCITIKRCHFNRRLEQLGAAPPDCHTFGITQDDHSPFHWRRHPICAGNILGFSDDVEMNGTSDPGFHLYAISIHNNLLRAAAQRLGYDDHHQILNREHVVTCSTQQINKLRSYCQQAISPPNFELNTIHNLVVDLHSELPSLMLERFIEGKNIHPIPTQLAKRQALRKAREMIQDSENPIKSVAQLCQLTGSSERTLRYAFMETFGVSPKNYLQALRLNAVKRILLDNNSSRVIADAANSQGFWHMGQFAADYKKMFGELPSTALGHSNSIFT